MSNDYTSIEDLLLATLDAVSRFRVGQREAVGAALDAGALLTQAKGRSALEWVLDQYKEKKPKDPTIREKFNNYRFLRP